LEFTDSEAPQFSGEDRIAFGVVQILKGLAEAYDLDTTDENFRQTPARVARAYKQIFGGLHNTEKQVEGILSAAFPCKSTQMIVQRNIRVYSMCPHHLLPVIYNVSVAYIPTPGGKVLGLSKLARITELLARRPVLQEQFVEDVTEALMKLKGCEGAACYAEGQHFCMMMRGACQDDAVTITSSLKGAFIKEDGTRSEFFDLARTK